LHRPGRLALGGQVQPERPDVGAEGACVGLPGQPVALQRADHRFLSSAGVDGLGRVCSPPFLQVTGPG
jgi:hypothetical protein